MENTNYIKIYLHKRRITAIKRLFLFILSVAAAVIVFFIASDIVTKTISSQSTKSVKDAVLRSAVQCYAIEGVYPAKLSYLEENYGLLINHEEYIVSYEAFSSNLLPTVTVLIKGE